MAKEQSDWRLEFLTTLLVVAGAVLVLTAQLGEGFSRDENYRNVTVDTKVNITNAFPEILSMFITENPITLTAGGQKVIVVNATIRDYDGFNDISVVNVTLFDQDVVNANSADDNNNHYTNSSCTQVNGNNFTANYTCAFNVWYYANNATWTANLTVADNDNATDSETNTTSINTLLALNVTPTIDYGNMAVGDTSATTIPANVTNFGNVQINVSLWGYGGVINDGLAMVCTTRNITIANERFHLNSTQPFASMTSLASVTQAFPNLTLVQRTNDSAGGEVLNTTYWRLQIPVSENPAGNCTGFVVFQAEST